MRGLLGSLISYHFVANGRSPSQCALQIFLLNVSIWGGKKNLNVKRCRVYGPGCTPFFSQQQLSHIGSSMMRTHLDLWPRYWTHLCPTPSPSVHIGANSHYILFVKQQLGWDFIFTKQVLIASSLNILPPLTLSKIKTFMELVRGGRIMIEENLY